MESKIKRRSREQKAHPESKTEIDEVRTLCRRGGDERTTVAVSVQEFFSKVLECHEFRHSRSKEERLALHECFPIASHMSLSNCPPNQHISINICMINFKLTSI